MRAEAQALPEQCWTLLGGYDAAAQLWQVTARRQVGGTPASVEADWAWTLAREEAEGDVAGFWHTHPPGAGSQPSSRDIRTMQAWCTALGKPLLCLISEEGATNTLAVYLFADDASEGQLLLADKIAGHW